jgi:hypothetical protein
MLHLPVEARYLEIISEEVRRDSTHNLLHLLVLVNPESNLDTLDIWSVPLGVNILTSPWRLRTPSCSCLSVTGVSS